MPRLALLPCLGALVLVLSGWQTQLPPAPAVSPTPGASQPCPLDPAVDGPWFDSVVAFEHFDMGRTHLFRCATFGGQFSGAHVVAQAKLPQTYVTPYNIVIKDGARFVYAGAYGDYPGAPGSFVAKLDAAGVELWRTQVFDAQAHPERWTYPGVVGVHPNGFVYVVYGTTLAKLDPDSGQPLASVDLPYLGAAEDSAYNGFDGFADGALVMKTVNRVAGCQEQGFSAFLDCPNPTQVPKSVIAVVDPDAMTLLAQAEAPEPIGGRLTSTRYDGTDLLYLMGSQNMFRYVWDGTSLRLDGNWDPVPYLQAGQTSAPASAVIGDWVVAQTNSLPSETPLSLVATRQSDGKLVSMQPFANLRPGEGTLGAKSFLPSMLSVDAPNGRIYVMDGGQGLVEAVRFDQQTGAMQELWRVRQRTLNFSTLVGPTDQRVFMATDVGAACPFMACLQNYTQEQIVFRDAATGRELARSEALPKMTSGALITPGDNGTINYLGLDGDIYQLTVQPRVG